MNASMISQPCTILYIEDDPDDVLLFRRAFARSRIPCDIRNVGSVEEAEAYLTGEKPYANRENFPVPTLMITDLAFRGGSGFDFLNWLRYHPEFAAIPVLCVSGTDDPRKLEQARNFGARCVAKTAMYREVMQVIEEALKEKAKR